jgi:peptidoglycan hydrolase-like protein with peptidoglycan-binding domain
MTALFEQAREQATPPPPPAGLGRLPSDSRTVGAAPPVRPPSGTWPGSSCFQSEETRKGRGISSETLPTPGREAFMDVPGLEGHRGPGPGLILRWNTLQVTGQVDVVLHFHGFSGRGAAMDLARDKEGASGLDWGDPRGLDPAPGRTRPTLGLLPRGHFYGGRSGAGYDFPALIRPGGARELIRWSLERFAARVGAGALTAGRLILTAHSGGGAALWRVLDDLDPHEVHVFDALYQSPAPLLRWAGRRILRDTAAPADRLETYMQEQGGALRVLYTASGGTAGNSLEARRQLEALLAAQPALRRWYAVERTAASHGEVPRRYGWRLLADAGAALPDLSSPGTPSTPAPPGARPSLRLGSRGEAVRAAQRRLNAVHVRELAAGRPGLPAAPLGEDGTFGRGTHAATVAFQQLAFPGETRRHDGVIGAATWARLESWPGSSTPARPGEAVDLSDPDTPDPDTSEPDAADPEASEFPDEEEAEAAPPPLPVTAKARAVPPGDPVPFAPPPAPGSFWPLHTNDREGRRVSYLTAAGHTVGRAGRAFLAQRKGTRDGRPAARWHVGLDLFARAGDTVVACEAGRIVAFGFFYQAKSGQRTFGLLVAHPGVVVNYGEVTADSLTRHGLAVGSEVRAGQPIAFVSDTNMLHFETYLPGTTRTARWWQGDPRPPTLLNPTRYLLFLQEHGLGSEAPAPAAPGELETDPPDAPPPLTGPRVPPGFRAVTRRGAVRGLARYGGGRVDETLRALVRAGRLTLPDDDLDTFQRVANVETGGLIQGLNTWDSAAVSLGFMQWTLQHGKLQEWIRRAGAAFRRYGIELDTGRTYTWTREGRTVSEQGAILGAATLGELRWDGWAQRFFGAGLDEEIIVAEVALAREHLRRHLAGLRAHLGDTDLFRAFNGHYGASLRVRGLFQAASNNLPVAARRGTAAALHAAGEASTGRFTEALEAALLEAYRERGDTGSRILSETRTGARGVRAARGEQPDGGGAHQEPSRGPSP